MFTVINNKKVHPLLVYILFCSILSLFLFLLSFGAEDDKSKKNVDPNFNEAPVSAEYAKNTNYQTILNQFIENGFTNIELVKQEDLVFGLFHSEGDIVSVTINGMKDFKENDKFPKNAKVIIKYHVFKEKEESKTDADKTLTTVDSTEKVESSEQVANNTTEITEISNEVITIDNNADFAEIMSIKGDNDPRFDEFAKKYMYKTIEFDGNIIFFQKHPNKKTRYDVMFMGGNYIDADTFNPGPTFRVQDVGMYELAKDSSAPEYIKVGLNGHYKFKIVGYRSDSAIFEVQIEEIKYR